MNELTKLRVALDVVHGHQSLKGLVDQLQVDVQVLRILEKVNGLCEDEAYHGSGRERDRFGTVLRPLDLPSAELVAWVTFSDVVVGELLWLLGDDARLAA